MKKTMEKIKLVDLIGKNVDGKRANIVSQGGKYHYDFQDIPKYRILKKVYKKIEKGVEWVYWEWVAQQGNLDFDCGYSGHTISENFRDNYLEIEIKGVVR